MQATTSKRSPVRILIKVEIFWDPPKGDFTKYYLYIDHLSEKEAPRPEQYLRLSSAISYESNDTTLVDLVSML
jgi:hypothetical protein